MSLLPVGISGEEAGYQIERSLRFNSADSAYLNRTPASAGNRKTWTWSGWVKRGALPSSGYYSFLGADSGAGSSFYIAFDNSTQQLEFGQAATVYRKTTQVFRDPSAWYHLVINSDTTQATASNRLKIYVNGVQVTAFATSNDPSLNGDWALNNNVAHSIGADIPNTGARNFFNGYLTEVNFIDGSALDPTSFGEFNTDTGVWQPKAYTGSYGTNGFYLNFSDNSGTTSTTLGKDSSGNGNNWTPNNFSVTAGAGNDSLVDTPTPYGTDTGAGGEVRSNYATLNGAAIGTDATLSNGNLDISYGALTPFLGTPATIGVQSGKWYWEVLITASSGATVTSMIGITTKSSPNEIGSYPGANVNGWGYFGFNGQKYNSGGTAYGATYTTNDVIGVAFDADAGTLVFYKNGVSQGTAFSGLTSGPYLPAIGDGSGGATFSASTNFGQRPFAYTAPSGFKALCTQNLPEPTIVDGGQYFNVLTWSGDGTSPRSIGSLEFQPDFVWGKVRNNTFNHWLYDSVRGASLGLKSNATDAELLNPVNGYVSAFNSDGFDVTAGTTNTANLNGSGGTYVAWNWKAGGSGVSNTDGTITSTVSANTDSGFSIVTYTGTGANATVGHGLGAVPSMILVKNRDAADAWQVYHAANTANPETDYLVLNTTAATADNANRWNDTLPTSTVFSIGNGVEVNTNTEDYVAYCFAPVNGYSAMSSFTGNGSADGPFIFTNHRPAFVLIKRTDTTSNWTILDFQREGYNVDNDPLYPNLSNAEGTTDLADLLSNGFKLRTTDASVNASGGIYIYMSLASNPFKISLAR